MNPSIDVDQLHRVKALLTQLPVGEDGQWCSIDDAAWFLCWIAQIAPRVAVDLPKTRKPAAAIVTRMAACQFLELTGKPVTRISKVKKGHLGQQEAGQFANFLEELFRILEIDARPAGQVRQLCDPLRENLFMEWLVKRQGEE